jgi:hypothetical protein
MGDIYRKTHLVVVWLGPSENNGNIEWMERLAKTLPSISSVTQLPEHGLPAQHDHLWPALRHLYRRKWFGRLWNFQEVVLATDVIMVCGQKSTGWEPLAIVVEDLSRLVPYEFCVSYEVIPSSENGFEAMINVSFARRVLRGYGYLHFSTLLRIADTKLISDPRDSVASDCLYLLWSAILQHRRRTCWHWAARYEEG